MICGWKQVQFGYLKSLTGGPTYITIKDLNRIFFADPRIAHGDKVIEHRMKTEIQN
jgi:hypothetical protein